LRESNGFGKLLTPETIELDPPVFAAVPAGDQEDSTPEPLMLRTR
jgi:hypothetical protein